MSRVSSPADMTMAEAGDALRSRDLASVELTQAVLDRLRATEPLLHAWVEVREAEALSAAAAADANLQAGRDLGPLQGIPIAVKDIFDLAGYPTRCGSRVREHASPAPSDAVSVARARAGGAVLLGKSVTQEFAAGVVSPPARNPWDPERIPGGSSGGSAAAVAVGSAIAGFGSDTGGSVRIPAGVCGVTGLKPTFGTIETTGVYPLAWSLDTVGPIARTVADAARFFDVIRDPSPHAPASASLGQPLKGLRVGVERAHFLARVQDEIAAAIDSSVDVLRDLGAEVFDVRWKDADLAGASAFVINRVETVVVHEDGLRATPELFGPELRLRMEATALYPAIGYARALRARGVCRESMAALFREHRLDAIVTPTLPAVAARADHLTIEYGPNDAEAVMLAYIRLTRPFNLTGQPALSVPCGFDGQGLPIGLQIVGRPYDEAMVCRIGNGFEQAVGAVNRRPPIIGAATAGASS